MELTPEHLIAIAKIASAIVIPPCIAWVLVALVREC